MEYMVLWAHSPEELAIEVNRFLQMRVGWALQGGVAVGPNGVLYQAMAR